MCRSFSLYTSPKPPLKQLWFNYNNISHLPSKVFWYNTHNNRLGFRQRPVFAWYNRLVPAVFRRIMCFMMCIVSYGWMIAVSLFLLRSLYVSVYVCLYGYISQLNYSGDWATMTCDHCCVMIKLNCRITGVRTIVILQR